MAVGQHAVRADESIPVQKWNSPQDGQVRYTDAAAGHQMTEGGLQLASCLMNVLLFVSNDSRLR